MWRNYVNLVPALIVTVLVAYAEPELGNFELVLLSNVVLIGLSLWDINKKLHEE